MQSLSVINTLIGRYYPVQLGFLGIFSSIYEK